MVEQSGDAVKLASPAGRASPILEAAIQVSLLLALWVVTHPYSGVIHDAQLYMLQALEALTPSRYSQDLFFRFGSQDSFTAFTPIYKHVVSALGPAHADLLAFVVGEGFWLAALAWLMRTLFPRRVEALFAIAAVIALHSGYGGGGVFHYAEPFVTPRLYAEALVLVALGLAWRGRVVMCALALALAAAAHPLMGDIGIGVILLFAAFHDRRVWILIALAAVAGVALAAMGVGPLGRAFVRLDDAWLRVVWQRCAFLFVSRWQSWDLCQVAATLSLLAGAWGLATARERRLIGATGLATLAGLAASFVGADLFHDVLIANLQPWRVLWLATLLANVFLAIIVLRSPADWASRKLLIVAAAVSVASNFLIALILIAPVLVLVACTVLGVEQVKRAPLAALTRIFAYVATALSVGLALLVAAVESPHEPHFVVLTLGAGLATSTIVLLVLLQRGRAGAVLAVTAAVVLVGSLAIADQREPWRKYVFSPGVSADLGAFASGAGAVYWEGDPGNQLLWFKLRRPSYFSCVQGAGSMFFRQTALEFSRRSNGLKILKSRTFSPQPTDQCPTGQFVDPWGANTAGQLAETCRALPDLDTIILNRPVPGIAARTWHAPASATYVETDGSTTKVSAFYRYSCAPLRQAAGALK